MLACELMEDPLDFPLNFEPCFWSGREVLCSKYIGTVYIVVSILHIRQFDQIELLSRCIAVILQGSVV